MLRYIFMPHRISSRGGRTELKKEAGRKHAKSLFFLNQHGSVDPVRREPREPSSPYLWIGANEALAPFRQRPA